jgi:eukaryotic-like serine/threonine-protein kinase
MGSELPQAGTRLGPYELIAPLGVGGMSEVHRARDTRLGREVAIKILDFEASRHAERLRLFEQEARAAGAIAHPSIVTVHDVGREGEISYVVLELVEGETLQRRLQRGRLPPRKALEIAIQIGHGLAAAHARGILHNDLKPANVILCPDGRVKILDFGLAGLRRSTDSALDSLLDEGDTLTQALFGTPGYIAPERIHGAAPDARSDVFSLGAVLYEMLAGTRAFEGETPAAVLTGTTEHDPPLIEPPLSPPLERVLRRALEKDPGQRFQSASDLAYALDALSAVTGAPIQFEPRAARHWPRRLAAAALALALVAAGLAAGSLLRSRPQPTFQRLTFRYGGVASARFTPDGRTVVYSAAWEGAPRLSLFTARTDTRGAGELPVPGGDVAAISRTGELALFPGRPYPALHDRWLSPGVTLSRVPMTGGALRDVLPDVVGVDWAPETATNDLTQLAVVRDRDGVRRLEFPIGHVLYEVPYGLAAPRFSPRGDRIALLEGGLAGESIIVVDLEGHRSVLAKGLTFTSPTVAWSPDGEEVWFSAEKLEDGPRYGSWRPALRAVNLSGSERILLRLPDFLSLQDVSADGRVLMTVGSMRAEIVGRPPGGGAERNFSWHEGSSYIELSRDGRQLLFFEAAELATYLRPTDGGPALRLCEGLASGLSPDGHWVARLGMEHYTGRLTLVPTQAGEPRVVSIPKMAPWALAWFGDSQRFVISGNEQGAKLRAWLVDMRGGEPRALTPEGIGCWLVSPDGRFAACARPEGEGFIYPVPAAGSRPSAASTARLIPGFRPGDHLRQWSADGRHLFVSERYARPARIHRLDLETGERTLWRELAPANPAGMVGSIDPAITPDGETWAYSVLRYLNDLYVVEGLR